MGQALAGGYHYQVSGKGLETVAIHYTHIYIMDRAIKFSCEYTKNSNCPALPRILLENSAYNVHIARTQQSP